jgi:ribonucleoside-diphosphate reductase alpha chain
MYTTSALLAEEKGFFPKFEKEKFLNSKFVRELPQDVIEKIKEKGIRNVALITQAPTGSTGTMLGTSTGIEPYFAFKFFRQSRLGFHDVNIPLAQEYTKNGKLPDFFVSAMELSPDDHIKVQAAVQRWTDSSISKTANVPSNFTIEQTEELYIKAYELGCKGVTIYRDSSRDEQVLSINKDQEKKNEISIQKQIKEKNKNKKFFYKQEDLDNKEDLDNNIYGVEAGKICPNCKKGIMVKIGGCTECSAGCGFKGSCDLK